MTFNRSSRTPFWFARGLRKACGGIAASGLLMAASAHAHEGHGMPGSSHWHASDIWGFVIVGALAAAAFWWKGRK